MSVNKKQIIEKQKQTIFAKQIVTKNPTFTLKQIQDFFNLFSLYCDNRRQCDVQDILTTAKTLGFDKSYRIVYDALILIVQELNGEWINFQKFLTMMTDKIGHASTQQGRQQIFNLCDYQGKGKLTFSDLRKISQGMKYSLEDQQIQEIITNVAGKGKREITWEQFNNYLAKRVEKKNTFI